MLIHLSTLLQLEMTQLPGLLGKVQETDLKDKSEADFLKYKRNLDAKLIFVIQNNWPILVCIRYM